MSNWSQLSQREGWCELFDPTSDADALVMLLPLHMIFRFGLMMHD